MLKMFSFKNFLQLQLGIKYRKKNQLWFDENIPTFVFWTIGIIIRKIYFKR